MRKLKFQASLIIAIALLLSQNSYGTAQNAARQIARAQQDNRLYNQMVKVSDWCAQYCVWNHRFPEGYEQVIFAKQQLNALVPNIPYDSGMLQLAQGFDDEASYANPSISPIASPQPIPVAANMDRIQVQSADLSLTNNDIQGYLTQPPDEWQAAPGTITAISNQTTTYLVWGAGRDGLPIKDPDTGKVRIIVGHFGLLFDNEE